MRKKIKNLSSRTVPITIFPGTLPKVIDFLQNITSGSHFYFNDLSTDFCSYQRRQGCRPGEASGPSDSVMRGHDWGLTRSETGKR